MKHIDVIIIGGGPGGLSSAIWCKRLGINHILIEQKDILGGQLLHINNKIIDYLGIEANNGRELQLKFMSNIEKINTPVLFNAQVSRVDPAKRIIEVSINGTVNQKYSYGYLIIATGSSPRKLGIPGEQEMIERGEIYSASRDSYLFRNKKVAVIGGGDRSFEGATLLAKQGAEVMVIHRSTHFRARKQYVDAVYAHPNIQVLTDHYVKAIEGEGKVTSITIQGNGSAERRVPIDAVFVRLGYSPNSKLFENRINISTDGLIVTNGIGNTSDSYIYAIGDVCTAPLYSSISSSIGQAAIVCKHISSIIN